MGPIRSSNGKLASRQAGKANPMETCNYMCILKTVATVDDEVIATAMTYVRRALRRRPNSFVGSLFFTSNGDFTLRGNKTNACTY